MPKFLRRDVVASLLVGVLLAIQLPFIVLGNRATACLSLLAIGGVLVMLAGVQGPDLGGWLTAGLGAVSATTGTIAISHPSTLLSTISIGSVLVLWAVNLTGHLTFRTPEPAS